MHQRFGNLFRQSLTAFLVASLVLCCCHAQLLVHSLPGATLDRVATNRAAATMPACCSRCLSSDTPGDRDQPASPVAPGDPAQDGPAGCQSCCIKGTGLKDPGLGLSPASCCFAISLQPARAPYVPVPAAIMRLARPDAVAPNTGPPTLLRLHCALVV